MIVSLGESLIDFIYTESGDSPVFIPAPGGSPYNTAIALRRLEVPAAYLGKVSHDMFGTMLLNHLRNNDVTTSTVLRSDAPTTLAFAKIVAHKAEYAFYTNGSADRSLTAEEISQALAVLGEPPQCIQIGSISLLLEPGANAIYASIAERDPNIVVSCDPNIRSNLITHPDAYKQRLYDLFSTVTIVKTSDEDLAWIFPDSDIRDGAQRILAMGTEVCVVTHGIKGSYWFSRGMETFAPTNPIAVVDTIGAGDTFHAGLLAYLYRNGCMTKKALSEISKETAQAAITFATHAAEGTCKKKGADPPQLSEVLAAMEPAS